MCYDFLLFTLWQNVIETLFLWRNCSMQPDTPTWLVMVTSSQWRNMTSVCGWLQWSYKFPSGDDSMTRFEFDVSQVDIVFRRPLHCRVCDEYHLSFLRNAYVVFGFRQIERCRRRVANVDNNQNPKHRPRTKLCGTWYYLLWWSAFSVYILTSV